MTDETAQLSPSVEDYLKAIYVLCEEGGVASTSAIAEALAVQPASVTGMVKRLAEAEYLEHVPYRGVRLTSTGVQAALRVLRRHRIIETYLTARLGYAWDDVHEEAERLEHAASDRLIERMAEALQDPRHDPHGAPIPTVSGEIEATGTATLMDAPVGLPLRVRAVRDDDPGDLRTLEEEGLVPGAQVTVAAREAEAGVTYRLPERSGTRRIGPEVARRVFVVPVETRGEGEPAKPDHRKEEP